MYNTMVVHDMVLNLYESRPTREIFRFVQAQTHVHTDFDYHKHTQEHPFESRLYNWYIQFNGKTIPSLKYVMTFLIYIYFSFFFLHNPKVKNHWSDAQIQAVI